MRLDKLLGQAGFGSRNQVKKLIRSHQVYVDGRLAEADNLNVEPSLQKSQYQENKSNSHQRNIFFSISLLALFQQCLIKNIRQ